MRLSGIRAFRGRKTLITPLCVAAAIFGSLGVAFGQSSSPSKARIVQSTQTLAVPAPSSDPRPEFVPMTPEEIKALVVAGKMNRETDASYIYFNKWGYMPMATLVGDKQVYISSTDYFGTANEWDLVDVTNKVVAHLTAGSATPTPAPQGAGR